MYSLQHLQPTFCLGTVIVLLAEQLLVLHQVELVSSVQLPVAEDTHEAVHMVHIVLSPPDHRAGRNSLSTPGTLGPVLPEEVLATEDLIVLYKTFVSERLSARSTGQALGMPGLIHNFEDEPIQDHASTGAALGNCR